MMDARRVILLPLALEPLMVRISEAFKVIFKLLMLTVVLTPVSTKKVARILPPETVDNDTSDATTDVLVEILV